MTDAIITAQFMFICPKLLLVRHSKSIMPYGQANDQIIYVFAKLSQTSICAL